MSSGQWYRVSLESNLTHQVTNVASTLRPCRAESKFPEVSWDRSWELAVTPGLPSHLLAFLWKMSHNLLPCPTRLFRLHMPGTSSDTCTLCEQGSVGDLSHCLLLCPYNDGAGQLLIRKISHHVPNLQPQDIVHLNINPGDKQPPLMYLVGSILSQIWRCRVEKKPCLLYSIRATLEAEINILRRSRHKAAAEQILAILEIP